MRRSCDGSWSWTRARSAARSCTSRPSASSRRRSTARRSRTRCSHPAGRATSGGCATAATTSPTWSPTRPSCGCTSATAGTAAGSGSTATATSTATSWAGSRSSRSSSRTATARSSAPTPRGRPAPSPDHRQRPVRRTDHRRPAAASRRQWVGVHELDVRHRPSGLEPVTADPSAARCCGRSGSGRRRAARRCSTSARTWSAGSASPSQGDAGQTITVRHAEVLEDGELCTRPLRTAQATDRLVLSGGVDDFEPTMTTHGFRYAGITGWPGTLTADDVEAVVVHSDMRRIGHFSCSDERLNRLHENAVWSWRGNSVGVPTDCPQRDERLGWTGDLAVFAPSAAYLFDVGPFLREWLVDLALEQEHADGRVPLCAPDCLKFEPPPRGPAADGHRRPSGRTPRSGCRGRCGRRTATTTVLRDQWPSMLGARRAGPQARLSERGLWEGGFQFGDWLDPSAPPDEPGQVPGGHRRRGDRRLLPHAHAGRCDSRGHRRARRGEPDRRGSQPRCKAAFNEHYVDDDGRVLSDCQTVYALAIELGLLDGDTSQRAGDRLAELVRADGHRIGTGFAGTAVRPRRTHHHGTPRRGVRAADADRVPVLALPGDHGCDHGLGALGLDAARRLGQPRRR